MTTEQSQQSMEPALVHQAPTAAQTFSSSPQAPNTEVPSLSVSHPVYIGFWERFTANLLDNIMLFFITLLLLLLLYGIGLISTELPNITTLFFYILSYLLPITLVVLFWHYKSATPGKMIFSIIIVDAKTLQKPSIIRLIVRYLGYIPSSLVLGLGYLWVAFDPRKQGWHDKLAGTLVIRAPKD
ncbi:hypothetical protein TUM17387_23930 [Shewanella carassii]|uniref:RDD family protein n=1 Tax=Shewanella carassii TaxID=1987584 RepID=UPI001BEDE11E|nr:RDD family protein [Shewanella carassii]BCV67034.1 hypothetical protein TUM17387_23930 [Shewanella carassii]